jgi:protein involved in polysaccharide export with SLBB domain
MALRHSVVNGGTYNKATDNRAAYARVTQLSREIAKTEEQIDERKAELRPGVIEGLRGPGRRSAATIVQPLQDTQTQRFMLGEGVSVAQNQPTAAVRRAPFSGKIRPGDMLNIEIAGGFSEPTEPRRTVEPDGNVAIGAAYGDKGRIQVAGKSLIEAGEHIEKELRAILKDPNVIVTYAGHDPDVVAEGEADKAANIPTSPAAEPVILAPLDTIEVRLGAKSDYLEAVNGTYLIEPDGRIALFDGRLKLAGLTELEAGNAIRAYFSQRPWQRKAPPSINVVRRGRAVFPEGKQPPAEYRVRAGDLLLVNKYFSAADGGSYEVAADGNFQTLPDQVAPKQEAVHVAGLTLEEVQKLLRERWDTFNFPGGGGVKTDLHNQPWMVTVGGWHEEADPQLIDRLGEPNDPRVQQLERELQQIKTMIHAQQR